jgi:hypothetical protein
MITTWIIFLAVAILSISGISMLPDVVPKRFIAPLMILMVAVLIIAIVALALEVEVRI